MIDFSIYELKQAFENRITLFNTKITNKDIEDTLLHVKNRGLVN